MDVETVKKTLNSMMDSIKNFAIILENFYGDKIEQIMTDSQRAEDVPSLAKMMVHSSDMVKFTALEQLISSMLQTLSRTTQSITSKVGS